MPTDLAFILGTPQCALLDPSCPLLFESPPSFFSFFFALLNVLMPKVSDEFFMTDHGSSVLF